MRVPLPCFTIFPEPDITPAKVVLVLSEPVVRSLDPILILEFVLVKLPVSISVVSITSIAYINSWIGAKSVIVSYN